MGLTRAGWSAEQTSLDKGQEEGDQPPTTFLPDPQLALPRTGLGRSCQQEQPSVLADWGVLATPPFSLPVLNGCFLLLRNTHPNYQSLPFPPQDIRLLRIP